MYVQESGDQMASKALQKGGSAGTPFALPPAMMNRNDNYTLWILSLLFLAIFIANATAKMATSKPSTTAQHDALHTDSH